MAGGPILIGGLDRSGKTQLRLALELAPDVAWTRRVEPWTRHGGRLGDVREPVRAERAIARLATDPRLAELGPDAARLRAELPSAVTGSASATIAEDRLFGLVLSQHAAAAGMSRWGLQEAGVERHAGHIIDAIPDAHCVILVRDPRDRLAALLADRRRPGAAGPATAAWLASVRHARQAAAHHSGRVLVVRLEDLAARPADLLRSICEHVDVAFDEQMLRPGGADPFGTLARSVGIHRTALGPGQRAFVEALAPRAMTALGYEPVPARLGSLDRIRYWFFEAPIGLGRLAASRARVALGGKSA